jgi:valyl-tRNA synthetase
MKPLPDKYDHGEAEKRWQGAWEDAAVYRWDSEQPRDNTYVIDTPPPTVSGMLHMGHVFSYTQADFIARYQRMSGKTVFYPMGFDDNGLPTERLVEKVKKVRPSDMSREDFIQLCMGVSEEARKDFRDLFTSIALSVDWNEEYHTVSEQSRRISQMSFLDLFGKERAYRKLQPMLWDPVDQTAIAQAEVEDKEQPSFFNDIHFAIDGSDEKVVIATTRPELLPACVAVFYHPDDARYQHLKGQHAVTPLFGVKVPILEDDTVEPEKGTGIMMCCTFGDEADIEKWQKHNLDLRLIINKYGKLHFTQEGDAYAPNTAEGNVEAYPLSANAVLEQLQGLKTKAAREKVIALLEESSDLVESKPIVHAVKCAERSGAPLEILPTYQWFVKVLDQKDELKAKAAEAEWHPKYMKVRMDQWIDGLSWDWCISRQRYFGVPFPVWYSKRAGEEGKILIASKDQLPVNPLTDLPQGYSRDEVEPDLDVMDTWATSSISPQLSSRSINAEYSDGSAERHAKLFPADLRPQAHEIIRTWAFYTVVKAHLHENTIPWKNLMISGWCLASDKTKMSKSKGNVVTPVELIRDKGSDVVRYWSSTSKLGADTAFSEDVLKIGKKLVNKLWNATKFAAIHLDHLKEAPKSAREEVENGTISAVLDRWVLTRLHRAIAKATRDFEKYEYSDARNAAEDFFWNDFCDNYLELVKNRVYGNEGDAAAQMSAVHTIYHCLNGILRLFAPFVPHVTEELFSYIFDEDYAKHGSIHACHMWPQAVDYPCDADAEVAGIDCVSLLEAVRKQKSERSISIKYPVEEIAVQVQQIYTQESMLRETFADLKGASNAQNVHLGVMQGDYPSRTATTATEDGKFSLGILFAAQSDVA